MKFSFSLKIGLAILLLAVGMTSLSVYFSYSTTRDIFVWQISKRLKDIGHVSTFLFDTAERQRIHRLTQALKRDSLPVTAESLHIEDLEEGDTIESLPDELIEQYTASEDFQRLVQILRQIKAGSRQFVGPLHTLTQSDINAASDPPSIKYAYLLVEVPGISDHQILKFIADADYEDTEEEEGTPVGSLYRTVNSGDHSFYTEAFQGEITAEEDFTTDKWGTTLAAAVPIKDANDKVIAVLGLDLDVDSSFNKVKALKHISLTIISVSIVLAILVAFILTRLLVHPIVKLRQGAEVLGTGHFDVEVDIKSRDEIGLLANAFNTMAKQLKVSYEQLSDYNRTLAAKVAERTKELSVANEKLQTTLDHLQATQQELVQSEKMAALGQLVAGIAHEVNTPLGAIRSSIDNISRFLAQNLRQLPVFFQSLSQTQQTTFFALLDKGTHQEISLSTREKRQLKKKLLQQLKEHEVDNYNNISDTLIDMNIYEDIEALVPALKHQEGLTVLETAYQLSSLQKSASTITTAVERASKVVFALKKFARFEHSGKKIQADVTESIETVLTLYHNQFKKGVDVIKHYETLPTVLCYPDELNQVWTNLIHNALQAMDYHGTLTIKTALRHEQVLISFTDTGCGIPETVKAKIFDPFFTTKSAGEGSGLGLDIVKKIIEKHGGYIEVDSEVGKTTFSIFLPIDGD
jgi:signal transduction histidine kinase